MNRNTYAGLSAQPIVNHPRSKFNLSDRKRGTSNVGELRCHFLREVLPGDTFKSTENKVVRLQTPTVPFYDDLYMDTFYFYCPTRLVWSKWKEFMGESPKAWYDEESGDNLTIPQITAPASTGWAANSLGADLGCPIGVAGYSVSAIPFRMYALIWSEFFRSTALQDAAYVPVGDSTQTGTNTLSNYVNDIANGAIAIACKLPDVLTLATPAPQRGPAVTIKIGELTDTANVYGNGYSLGITDGNGFGGLLKYTDEKLNGANAVFNSKLNSGWSYAGTGLANNDNLGIPTKAQIETLGAGYENATGLVADVSLGEVNLVTINELRTAFQIQKYFEKLAIGGDRLVEQIKSLFGVSVPDYRVQRPEYLGGERLRLNCSQVVSTNGVVGDANTATSVPLGGTGAYSLTADSKFVFDKSFCEHGYIIGLNVVRYHHGYQNGCPATLLRKTRFDFYTPLLQSIGEVGIKNKQVFTQSDTAQNPNTGNYYNDEIFGYQEAWFDYRYDNTSNLTGEMLSAYTTPLDSWHFADKYTSLPSLSAGWIIEDKSNVDRALAVQSSVSNQLFFDICVDSVAIRPMPVHSIPGNIDHYA